MMQKFLTSLLSLALFGLAAMLALPAYAADAAKPSTPSPATAASPATDSTSSKMEILREKIYADKKLLVANNMTLTPAEEKTFWSVYDAYQKDLHKINERLVKLINDYAVSYRKGAMLNSTAKVLLDEMIAIELAEAKLKQSYAPKLLKVLPAAKAARYLQIENKIRAIIRYELAEGVPLAE
jgi:hypothetical protein